MLERGVGPLYKVQEQVEYPFGKGSLTVTGTQFGAETTGITNSAYVVIPAAATVTMPPGASIVEIEFGLTAQIKSSGTADSMLWKAQAGASTAAWEDLIGEQTVTAAAANTAYTDKTCSGRFGLTGNFTDSNPFYVRMVAKSGGATDTLSAKVKNASYVRVLYKIW